MLTKTLSTYLILSSISLIFGQVQPENPDPDCICVPFYNCNANNTIKVYGEGLFNYRVNSPRQCPDQMEFCCSMPDIKRNETSTEEPIPYVQKGCGLRNRNSIGFRISGDVKNVATEDEYPWMALIMRVETVMSMPVNVYKCGGSIINENVVMTAAHCLKGLKESDLFVRAGDWDMSHETERLPHQDRKVSNIIRHPQFNAFTGHYDVALLILSEPFELADNVDVVCLPEKNEVIDSKKCIVTGWGKDKFGENGIFSKILKAVELPIVPSKECQTRLRKTRLTDIFILHPSLICAGGVPGEDACEGDGGSPLVCPLEGYTDRYVQPGIVSWGIECNTAAPGAYANVALVRPWIDETLTKFVINPSSYSSRNFQN